MTRRESGFVALAALAVAPLWAHHSAAAEYDASKLLVLTGKVAFQAADARRLDDGSLDTELLPELGFPLIAQVRGADHRDAFRQRDHAGVVVF